MATVIQRKHIIGNLNDEAIIHNKWLIFAGFTIMCLGLLIVVTPTLATSLQSHILQVSLLAIGGAMYIAHAMVFWRFKIIGFALHVLAGIIYILAGYIFFTSATENTLLLAEILMASYLITGIFRITVAIAQGIANLGWSWTLLCGIVNIALGYFLWQQSPFVNLAQVNLTIGTELSFTGLALFMLGTHARREIQHEET